MAISPVRWIDVIVLQCPAQRTSHATLAKPKKLLTYQCIRQDRGFAPIAKPDKYLYT